MNLENGKYTASVWTLGCRVNQYESRAMEEALRTRGIEVFGPGEVCDVYIINTCTVTSESDRKARQLIRRAKTLNPSAGIVVTGCFAEASAEVLEQLEGVDRICGNKSKLKAVDAAQELLINRNKPAKTEALKIYESSMIDGGDDFEPLSITGFDRTRAYIKIEDGCDGRCAYCIIPKVRGHVRSRPIDDITREVTELCKNGCREVVLTGIETSAYEWGLAKLAGELSEIEGLERIRLSSLDPAFLKPDVTDELSEIKKLMPHFHLSIQSGSSRILALMRRKYNGGAAMKHIEYLKSRIPDVCLTADFICGFPGETDEDFAETVKFVKIAGFIHSHIFTYSVRPGTEAAEMTPQVPESVKISRSAELSAVSLETAKKIVGAYIGKVRPVLFEGWENCTASGHTDNFIEVSVKTAENPHNLILPVKITGFDGEKATGELCNI